MPRAKDGHYFSRWDREQQASVCDCRTRRRAETYRSPNGGRHRLRFVYRQPGGEWTSERPPHEVTR
jgi:hypothetical protein